MKKFLIIILILIFTSCNKHTIICNKEYGIVTSIEMYQKTNDNLLELCKKMFNSLNKSSSVTKFDKFDEEYSEEQDYPDAIAELETKWDELPDSGFYRTLQKVEEIDGKYYAIVANSVSNSLEAIGWRESYDLLNVEYYCYSEIEGAKKILDCPCLDGTVTMQTWVVGEKGKKANALVYRRCNIESVESEPKLAEFFYTAKLAEDLVYEHPANGDINGDWTKDGVDAFLKDTAGAADGEFLTSAPDRDEMGGLKMPGDGKSQLYYHVGFNDEGEINYIRPVVFD